MKKTAAAATIMMGLYMFFCDMCMCFRMSDPNAFSISEQAVPVP